MSSIAQRLTANTPGRLESHGLHRRLARPYCVLQALSPDDLDQALCDGIPERERRMRAVRADAASFTLHQQFLRAHGSPKGEFTTLTGGSAICGGGGIERAPRNR